MKTIKEILECMLENQEEFKNGLCGWVNNLLLKDKLTLKEHCLIRQYIAINRPSKCSSKDAYIHRNDSYYWKPGNIEPRIKWTERHIKLFNSL